MKNAVKYTGLFAVGLWMAMVVYPALHEGSHAAVAWLLGAPVAEVQVLSAPYVRCDVGRASAVAVECIGWSGSVLPWLGSILVRPRSFWGWYAVFVWRCIAVFSCVLAGVSTLLYIWGTPLPYDDVTQLLTLFPHHWRGYLLLSAVLSVTGSVLLARERPFHRCVAYFV